MSRRSRLATVVRVADLRESVARGAVAAAGAATARALQQEGERRDALAAEAGMAAAGGAFLRHVAALKSAELVVESAKRLTIAPALVSAV